MGCDRFGSFPGLSGRGVSEPKPRSCYRLWQVCFVPERALLPDRNRLRRGQEVPDSDQVHPHGPGGRPETVAVDPPVTGFALFQAAGYVVDGGLDVVAAFSDFVGHLLDLLSQQVALDSHIGEVVAFVKDNAVSTGFELGSDPMFAGSRVSDSNPLIGVVVGEPGGITWHACDM